MNESNVNYKLNVNYLRCEYLVNPIGIDIRKPRFSWQIKATRKGVMQSAYQIIVIQIENGLNKVIWDTDKIMSDNSINCEYDGPELKSKQRYYWKVRIWDEKNKVSEWSELVFFEMGLLKISDWKAKWVEPIQKPVLKEKAFSYGEENTEKINYEEILNPCLLLRKTFLSDKDVKKARIYATAHGCYEIKINGKRVGNQQFTPGNSSYDKYLEYQTFDITDNITKGNNAIGVILSDGWYAGRVGLTGESCQFGDMLGLLLQLDIEYKDGSSITFGTDESFKSSTGPFIYSDIFIGEKYDARLEKNGWDTSNYNDSQWQNVNVKEYDLNNVVAQYGELITVIEEIKAEKIIRTPNNETIIDFGQVIAGRVCFKVNGAAGTEITLEHSEVLDENGNFFNNTTGRNKDQKDIYILNGNGEEVYEPHFTFHGFRYVKVTGYPGVVEVCKFKAVVISSDLRITGKFQCSNPLINRLQENIVWSQKANFLSIPTDCPQRERAGWTGDIQAFAPTASFNMDIDAFLTRWLRILTLDQKEDGQVPNVVPYIKAYESFCRMMSGGSDSSAGWGDACIIVPWVLYNRYGDKRVLEDNYTTMIKWMSYIEKSAAENIPEGINETLTEELRERQKYLWNTGFHFGDWLIPSLSISEDGSSVNMMKSSIRTRELVATCFYAYSTELMSKICAILGKEKEAFKYLELNKKVCKAFSEEYLSEGRKLKAHFQGIYVLALKFNMIPDNMRDSVLYQFINLIEENDYKLDTGFLSVPFLMDVLCEHGYRDIANKILYQKECPSWLYEVEKGATTIWEAWQAIMPDGKVTDVSYNHYAFGVIGDWLYRTIAGINPGKPGYKHIIIKPEPDEIMTYAKASYESVYGEIASEWNITDGMMTLDVKIPPNTTASVYIQGEVISEINKHDVISMRQEIDKVIVDIGSGEYSFQFKNLKL